MLLKTTGFRKIFGLKPLTIHPVVAAAKKPESKSLKEIFIKPKPLSPATKNPWSDFVKAAPVFVPKRHK